PAADSRPSQARYPQWPLLVTTSTLTGSRQVQEAFGEQIHHVYAPYDLPGAVARFLRLVRPRLANYHGNRVVAESVAAMRGG
ncbi:MAG: hypothetical protein HC889_17215, partial [Synechococcaceae cyanobacterium SM1_2_3]|nr:hypothetical protein [Synechococcaceae cyanobacterium SM1_2_3]